MDDSPESEPAPSPPALGSESPQAARSEEGGGQERPPPPLQDQGFASVVPIERDDEVDGICGRIDAAPTLAVVLHARRGNAAMAEELGLRRVVRHVEESGRVFAIATSSAALTRRARALRVPVARNPRKVHWRSGGKMVLRLGRFALLLPPLGRYVQPLVLVAVVLLILAGLLTAGPGVTVTVYPPTRAVERLAVVTASPRVTEIDLATLTVPATIVSVEQDILLALPTTGTISRGVANAVATLTVTNPSAGDVALPAGAVLFAGSDLIPFALDEATTVPAGGTVTAAVTASFRGSASNVAVETISQWRDEAFAELVATNPAPASGGADEVLPAVAPADTVALQALVLALPEQESLQALLVAARPNDAVIVRTATITITMGEPSASPGTPADVLFMEVHITIEALAILSGTLDELAQALLSDTGGVGVLVPGTVTAVETGASQLDRSDGSYRTELRLHADFAGLSPEELEGAVKGKSESEAEAELLSRYGIDDVEIDLTPGWAPWLPRFGFRIDVAIGSRALEPVEPVDPVDPVESAEPALTQPSPGP